jgi:hypothetical protein
MAFSRNNAVTSVDLTTPPQFLRVYASDQADIDANKRVLLQGLDSNGNIINTQDGFNQVTGEFVELATPFSQGAYLYSQINGIQKDTTSGTVQIFQVDPTSGAQVLLATLQPTETTSIYRRYYFHNLPRTCCPSSNTNACTGSGTTTDITVTALAKLEPLPAYSDTDYLVIQNLEAMILEAESLRLSGVDNRASKEMSQERHLQAVRLLNGELTHYLGKNNPAVNFAPFGTARLNKVRVGMI